MGSSSHMQSEEEFRRFFAGSQSRIDQQVNELGEKAAVFNSVSTSDAERLHLSCELDEECECIAGQLNTLHNQAMSAAMRQPRTASIQLQRDPADEQEHATCSPGHDADLDLARQLAWLNSTRSRVTALKESFRVTTYSRLLQLQRDSCKRESSSGSSVGQVAGAEERSGFVAALRGYVLELDRELSHFKLKLLATLSGQQPVNAKQQPVQQFS